MRRPSRAFALTVLLVLTAGALAGCFGDGAEPATDPDDGALPGGDDDETPPAPPERPDYQPPSNGPPSRPEPGPPSNGHNNTTGEANETRPEWPSISQATIRPGVALVLDEFACTSNFVFRSKTNGTLYLGTASHCVEKIGQEVRMWDPSTYPLASPGAPIGRVAYSSFLTSGYQTGVPGELNDFALIEIYNTSMGKVHPAALHFGGPVGLAPADGMPMTSKVVSHGNTPFRPGPDQADRLEGYVAHPGDAWSFDAYFLPYSWGGDSGSGVMTGDGDAAGILVRAIAASPPVVGGLATVYTSYNIVTKLEPALAYAEEHGFPVELQTWDTFSPGVLPG